MPLPRYQPVKKRLKISSPSLDDLDDFCLARIIGHALVQSKWRSQEPYLGDNGTTERNLSLVSKRWYFLTQTQVVEHGVHKINLEEALKRESRPRPAKMGPATNGLKTPKRPVHGNYGSATINGARTPAGSYKLRPNYGILSQRNMTNAVAIQPQQQQANKDGNAEQGYDIKLFKAIRLELLKYKHVQLCGSITSSDFVKLVVILNSTRVERLDLLGVKIESAKTLLNSSKLHGLEMLKPLIHLQSLTFTITNCSKDDPTNALLWTIYQRATNLKDLRVYLVEKSESSSSLVGLDGELHDNQQAGSFIERLTSGRLHKSHPHLTRVVFDRIPTLEPGAATPASQDSRACSYSTLVKKVLSEERGVTHLDTNDPTLVGYLVQASNRLCTKLELRRLILSSPLASIDLLHQLVKLKNLGSEHLSIVIDNFDQIAEVKTILEDFNVLRPGRARCTLNLYLKDQKFSDCDDKVKCLIHLTKWANINVFISALQRISIDCCHLMWSTGRALQTAATMDMATGRCIFKITLQTYPVKPNTVNPFEITIPFGRCTQYKISSISEDIVRHREIMKALKKDCYHQFVKSVRENNTP